MKRDCLSKPVVMGEWRLGAKAFITDTFPASLQFRSQFPLRSRVSVQIDCEKEK